MSFLETCLQAQLPGSGNLAVTRGNPAQVKVAPSPSAILDPCQRRQNSNNAAKLLQYMEHCLIFGDFSRDESLRLSNRIIDCETEVAKVGNPQRVNEMVLKME